MKIKHFLTKTCKDYSIPLIFGVLCAMVTANVSPEAYHRIVHTPIWGEEISFHWLVNDIFMVFFFATAGVEIINSLSKGGALNPLKRAITPLMATVGGVLGPIVIFSLLNAAFGDSAYSTGWGVCTATDIALAWLAAKLIFGAGHPAVKFLLLLAVADDAIGLAIIAIFYPQPGKEFHAVWLLLVPAAMLLAWIFNKMHIRYFEFYVLICGAISWIGMHQAGLHAALSLIFIVPFLPRTGKVSPHLDEHGVDDSVGRSALHTFEMRVGPVVDYGLFFFGFTSAGVQLSTISTLSVIIFLSFLFGKSLGIFSFTLLSTKLKSPLPEGMKMTDVVVLGVIGAIGLTVALFVSESAFIDAGLTAASKMGALSSILALIPAFILARLLKIQRMAAPEKQPPEQNRKE